jgi:uncharacterized protein involved in exopolysaccharide biosynthesis
MGDSSAMRPEILSRPRYAPMDFLALLWRERWLMLAVFIPLAILGFLGAMLLKPTYTSSASLLIRLGQEYVYEPRAGDAARGAVPDVDQVIQSETEIIGSEEIRKRVLRKLGLAYLSPKIAAKYAAATPDKKEEILRGVVEGMGKSLKIETAPETSVVRLSYKADKGEVAARILNSILEEYLIYRRSVLLDTSSDALARQKSEFEQRLFVADQAYNSFLARNKIGDFVAQKTALAQLQAQLETQQYQNQQQIDDRSSRLASLTRGLGSLPKEISLYRDISSAAGERLAGLRAEREALLSRYRPDSQPVKDLELQISQLDGAISSGRTQTEGARRIGVNPVQQTLETERLQTEAENSALLSSRSTLSAQLNEVVARLQEMAELEPEFLALSRDREVLQAAVRDFTLKLQQSSAAREIADQTVDNIRIVNRAQPPTKPVSLRKPVLMLAVLFALFSALSVGLIRMFLRSGLQTVDSAGRTFGLPVLGSAGIKR